MKEIRWMLAFLGVIIVLAAGITGIFQPSQADSSPPSPPLIRLEGATFDPLAEEPDISSMPRLSAQAGRLATYLVQFIGPVQEKWKIGVETTGARLYGYVPDFAFIARMEPATVEQVEALPFVRWVGLYHQAYRLSADLQTNDYGMQSTAPVTVTVQTIPDADLDHLLAQVQTWSGEVQSHAVNELTGYLRVVLDARHLYDLASQDGVLWVEPYFEPQLYNDVGGGTIMRADEIRADLGLYGSGQIVAVADTGLDVGTMGPQMSDDFEGRIVEGQAICANFTGGRTTWSDFGGHGTHVAGSVLGNGVLSGSDPNTHSYANSFAGLAPEAQLVFQSIDDPTYESLECIPDDRSAYLFGPAHELGARVHTNSWGGPTGGNPENPEFGGYGTEAQITDQGTRTYQDMLILYAAGNSGVDANSDGVVDPDSVGSPGTSKNVLTVGASENYRPGITTSWGDGWADDFPTNPIFNDYLANASDGMAAFSSRGPTDDGRIKPDITAPGTMIISTRSHDPNAGTGWGVYNDDYIYMGGTSMATPLTAGGAALVREWLTEQKGVSNPSAALMKGVLINGAADMSPGQYGTGATQEIPNYRPNYVTGWGRVDLNESLNPPAPREVWFKDNGSGVSTGGEVEYTLSVGTSRTIAETKRQGCSRSAGRATHLNATASKAKSFSAPTGIRPLGTTQLLQNPGFESGVWTPWTIYTNGSVQPYLTDATQHGGTWSAHMGNETSDVDQVYQEGLSIPADNVTDITAEFWYRVRTDEFYTDYYDQFCYVIWNQDGSVAYDECLDIGALGDVNWTKATWTMSADQRAYLAGKTVSFGFQVDNDSSLLSRVWVDDTAFNVTTSGGTEPSLTINPKSGPRGTAFSVTGSDFDAADTITIAIDGTDQLDVTSDGSGGFSFDLTPPGTVTKGEHTVTATDTGGHSVSDTFEIVPSVSVDVSPASGEAGDSFSVTGSGFHGGSPITVTLDGATAGTTTVNADGAFTYTLNTEASIADGSHTVNAVDDESSTDSDTFTIGGGETCPEVLDDGGFEESTGDSSNPYWSASDNARFFNTPGGGHGSSDYVALLGYSDTPSTGEVWQSVSVPADAVSGTLSFWYQDWNDNVFALDVDITDGSGSILVDLPDLTSGDSAWQQYNHTFTSGEMMTIVSQSVRLRFRIHDVSEIEDVAVDDVSWQICSGATPPEQREVSITPEQGYNGSIFTISGSNFTSDAEVALKVDSGTVKTVTADGDGSFSTTYTPTGLDVGQHTLVADDGDGQAQDTFEILTAQTGGPFRVTLVWTDYPGTPGAARSLVNDLDLEVIAPDGTHYYGNQSLYENDGDPHGCRRDGKWDQCNNVEGIIIPEAAYGAYTIKVHGYNVAQEGPQPFAVVASGDNLSEYTGPPPDYDNFIYLPLVLRDFGESRPTAEREVNIVPSSGSNGTTFTISGHNFTPGAGAAIKVDGNMVKTVTVGGDGAFTTTYTPTGLTRAQHTITVGDGEGQAQVIFTITAPATQQVLFVHSEFGYDWSDELWAMAADGSQPQAWWADVEANYPAWSRDGETLVLIKDGTDIVLVNADGTNPRTVFEVPGCQGDCCFEAMDPALAPDETAIAYGQRFFCADPPFDQFHVRVVNADGTGDTELAAGGSPDWSPDGTKIAYNSGDIYVMNADGSNSTQLAEEAWEPHWSPGGDKIAYVKDTGFYKAAVYLMDTDGSNPTRLAEDVSDTIYDLAWSPDGSDIYFDVDVGSGAVDIYRVTVTTGVVERLTQDGKSHAPAPR